MENILHPSTEIRDLFFFLRPVAAVLMFSILPKQFYEMMVAKDLGAVPAILFVLGLLVTTIFAFLSFWAFCQFDSCLNISSNFASIVVSIGIFLVGVMAVILYRNYDIKKRSSVWKR